jgi:hypothetical protein
VGWNGFEEMVHQEGVDHGGLIDDDHICLKRIVLVFLKVTLMGRVFKEAMNGLCLPARCLIHSLGCPSCGSCKKDPQLQLLKDS